MRYLIATLVAVALLFAFPMLTRYEARRGARFFAPTRARLDRSVEHAKFIFTHVDFAAFLRGEVRHGISRLGHAIAHYSLQAVRATERLLTRLVRYLRTRHPVDTIPRENVREFVRTLSDFKGHLEATRPKIPEL